MLQQSLFSLLKISAHTVVLTINDIGMRRKCNDFSIPLLKNNYFTWANITLVIKCNAPILNLYKIELNKIRLMQITFLFWLISGCPLPQFSFFFILLSLVKFKRQMLFSIFKMKTSSFKRCWTLFTDLSRYM